jgi:hypothetical protein
MTIQITTGNQLNLDKIYRELLGRPVGQEGKDYWSDQFASGMSSDQIQKSIKAGKEYKEKNPISIANIGTTNTTTNPTGVTINPSKVESKIPPYSAPGPDLTDPAITGYRGAAETGYDRTVPTFTGGYRKSSKNDRSAENLYHQNILDELTSYAQQSGLGNFAISEGSVPQWMPTDASRESIIDPHYRNQASRATEDLWQQGQISDLEKWAQNIVGSGKYDLSFNPSEAYLGMNKAGTGYSEHLEEGKRRNISQSSGIDSLIDFISNLDTARGPERDADKSRLSGIYGTAIDNTYRTLFETTDKDSEYYGKNIDQAGREYWTKDLIENRPGLSKGQDWQTWLSDAFKNTESYKDFIVNKGPERIDIPEQIDLPIYSGGGSTGTGTPLTDYSQQLQTEKDSWDIKFDDLTSMYTDQINDLKSAFEKSNRDQAALFKGYQDQVAGYREDLNAQAAYGERPMNQTVKGVKTKNELPGYKPKTGGSTGHFNRTGSRLSTKSLNVA